MFMNPMGGMDHQAQLQQMMYMQQQQQNQQQSTPKNPQDQNILNQS